MRPEDLEDLVGYVSCEAKGLAYKFARFWALPWKLLGRPKASIAKILDVSRSALYHFIQTRKIAPG